jgi:hypothetical protein
MNPEGELRVVRVSEVSEPAGEEDSWLIENLWSAQAVGLIGGTPKCGKTWLALEMAVAVASGRPCLGRFSVRHPGPVLVYAAEDPPPQVRTRLEHLARARGTDFGALEVHLIVEASMRLDGLEDHRRLQRTLARYHPRLLVLDPWVRLQRAHENDATEVSAILARLRELSREYELAIALVHHARKDAADDPGQSLRGSSDFHAWGDSNLYLRRRRDLMTLTVEHRSAAPPPPMSLKLVTDEDSLRLQVREAPSPAEELPLEERVVQALADGLTRRTDDLRGLLRVRKQDLMSALRALKLAGRVRRHDDGWLLAG